MEEQKKVLKKQETGLLLTKEAANKNVKEQITEYIELDWHREETWSILCRCEQEAEAAHLDSPS